MRYCEGLNTVFEFLKNNKKLTSYLTTMDWQWLAVMKAYECNRFLNLMPKEVRVLQTKFWIKLNDYLEFDLWFLMSVGMAV